MRVDANPALVQGKTGASINTTAEPADALALLLGGTGLVAVPVAGGFEIRAGTPEEARVLPPVNVVGHAEQAWSQVEGYVAHRSQTATKTDTPILETPQSVAVVTREEMDDQNVQSVKQALRYTQGVTPDSRANFQGFDVLYARGFTADRYLDGLKLLGGANYTTPQIDPYELERVEVLLGPASTLYGQASPGGIVNMISKRPTSETQGEVRAQVGNYSTYSFAFDASGALNADKTWLYRVTGIAHDGDTQVDYVKDRHSSIAAALTWRPSRDTEFTFLSRYDDAPDAGYYNFVPAQGSLLPNPNGTIPTSFNSGDPSFQTLKRREWSLGYHLEQRLNDTWVLRQNLRYMSVDGTVNSLQPLFLEDDLRTLERYVLADDGSLQAFGVDTQLEARFAWGKTQNVVLVGIDYQHLQEDDTLGLDYGPPIDIFAPVYGQSVATPAAISDTRQTQRQLGIYAQEQLKVDDWAFLAGIRQDAFRAATLDNFSATTSSQSDDKFSWRVGGTYTFANGVAPYASYVTSFQPVAGIDYAGNAFQPTTGKQWEAGVKFQPLAYNALFTVALFNLEQSNVPTIDPDHPTFNTQTGKIRTRGAELSAKTSLDNGLSLSAAYTYLDAKVVDSEDVDQGKVPLYVPQNAASLWLDYAFQTAPVVGLSAGIGVRYVGATWADAANTVQVGSNTLVDAALRWDFGRSSMGLKGFSVAINASNLFDKKYVSECTNDNCLYGLRRVVMGTLAYRW